jgi:hypothetical protein
MVEPLAADPGLPLPTFVLALSPTQPSLARGVRTRDIQEAKPTSGTSAERSSRCAASASASSTS